jgi:hypothetical protein
MFNKFVDFTGILRSKRIKDWEEVYGPVYSSRKVIKNRYINKEVNGGFYEKDVWSEWGDIIYPYIEPGMTIYGEICGYVTGTESMIQKTYDYGCEVGKNKMMVYRITTTNENGTKREWEISEVKEWTERLVKEHPEIADRIHVIDVLYHGTLQDLYPELSLTEHWHENVVANLRNDKKRFHMETNDPLCKNKVPFEGIVLRIDGDEIKEAFKLKCEKFLSKERKDMDEGNVDIEMVNNYVDDGDGEL